LSPQTTGLSSDAAAVGLPVAATSFVGRKRDIERAVDALLQNSIVTLAGVGGVGKTRLSIEIAASVGPTLRDGVRFVELAPVRDPSDVAGAISRSLGISDHGIEDVIEHLASKQVLLVIDYCEHLIRSIGQAVGAVVAACPEVRVLTTTREPLGIPGEEVLGLRSMPEDDGERLFLERASAVAEATLVTDDGGEAVRRLCRRLDAMPLAIELAAGHADSMSPTELADSLEERFALISGGRRRAIERYQTMSGAIDWTYRLLDETEQRLLARLSMFGGTWTLESALAVCGFDPLGEIAELVDTLVTRYLVVPHNGYILHEMVRQYAEERLADFGEIDEVLRRIPGC
jgi:predicted ATPase